MFADRPSDWDQTGLRVPGETSLNLARYETGLRLRLTLRIHPQLRRCSRDGSCPSGQVNMGSTVTASCTRLAPHEIEKCMYRDHSPSIEKRFRSHARERPQSQERLLRRYTHSLLAVNSGFSNFACLC